MHIMSIAMIVPFITSNPSGGFLGFRPIRVTVMFIHQSRFTAQQIISLMGQVKNYRIVSSELWILSITLFQLSSFSPSEELCVETGVCSRH